MPVYIGNTAYDLPPDIERVYIGGVKYYEASEDGGGGDEIVLNSLVFGGETHILEVPDSPSLDFGTGAFVVEFFMKADPTQQSYARVIGKEVSADNSGWAVYLSSGVLRVYRGTTNYTSPDTDTNLADGNWHHVSVHFHADNTVSFTTDSLYESSVGLDSLDCDSSEALDIGNSKKYTDRWFTGEIADVRIWRGERTEVQIAENINAKLNGDETDLELLLQMTEGSGTSTADATANNNDGTITDASWNTSPGLPDLQIPIGVTGYSVSLSEDNYAIAPSSFIENPSDNQWALKVRIRNLDTSIDTWATIFGEEGQGAGFLALHRTGTDGWGVHYRDTAGNWYESPLITYHGFTTDVWIDLLVYCDGTNIYVSVPGRTIEFAVAETPVIDSVGKGYFYDAEGAVCEMAEFESWNLEGYSGAFERNTILGETPTHRYELNEGSGTNVPDSVGTLDASLNLDETGMWNSL